MSRSPVKISRGASAGSERPSDFAGVDAGGGIATRVAPDSDSEEAEASAPPGFGARPLPPRPARRPLSEGVAGDEDAFGETIASPPLASPPSRPSPLASLARVSGDRSLVGEDPRRGSDPRRLSARTLSAPAPSSEGSIVAPPRDPAPQDERREDRRDRREPSRGDDAGFAIRVRGAPERTRVEDRRPPGSRAKAPAGIARRTGEKRARPGAVPERRPQTAAAAGGTPEDELGGVRGEAQASHVPRARRRVRLRRRHERRRRHRRRFLAAVPATIVGAVAFALDGTFLSREIEIARAPRVPAGGTGTAAARAAPGSSPRAVAPEAREVRVRHRGRLRHRRRHGELGRREGFPPPPERPRRRAIRARPRSPVAAAAVAAELVRGPRTEAVRRGTPRPDQRRRALGRRRAKPRPVVVARQRRRVRIRIRIRIRIRRKVRRGGVGVPRGRRLLRVERDPRAVRAVRAVREKVGGVRVLLGASARSVCPLLLRSSSIVHSRRRLHFLLLLLLLGPARVRVGAVRERRVERERPRRRPGRRGRRVFAAATLITITTPTTTPR